MYTVMLVFSLRALSLKIVHAAPETKRVVIVLIAVFELDNCRTEITSQLLY